MTGVGKSAGDLVLSRYECKYFAAPPLVDALRAHLRPFVRPDAFAAGHEDHRYLVSSLYLDSPDLRLYRTTVEGIKTRFKLRIRRYAEDGTAPAFLEIKQRLSDIVIKRRTSVDGEHATALLDGLVASMPRHGGPVAAEDSVEGAFRAYATLLDARPSARIRYLREAYESTAGEGVRITFDTLVEHAIAADGDANGRATWHRTPVEGVIVEVKFTEAFPSWVASLVTTFQLQRQSIPKYVLSMDAAIREGRYQPASVVPLASGYGMPAAAQLGPLRFDK
jgi:hypothetical protein